MKKLLAISSVLLGVVFLAGCGQQQTSQIQPTTPAPVAQTPEQPVATQTAPIDETSSWQTYSSVALGYEIKYPKNWTKINTSGCQADSDGCFLYLESSPYNVPPLGEGTILGVNPNNKSTGLIISVSSFSNPNKLSMGEFITKELRWGSQINQSSISKQIIAKNEFTKIPPADDLNLPSYFISAGSKIIEIDGYLFIGDKMSTQEKIGFEKIYNQVLSTLKFNK
ncbi:hypothetical protein A2477_00425 [Candidatus Falkowbacteria bacterium RIFOXYC2_FULL_47_12]|uniref:Uncharacterized protein n=2 Tax=Candidatus Falkowiibacteriota TaxID=1752728 RepID=A0A1F5TLV2_9BACT|nr:MAG: hypothetical protein A2242_03470 [Candidatus Falkowbacteria bacterium RIFOXYA2_FULL_47_9]OGF39836.1 MAG: hypothetical protein A2477_00425 [Candidatus Falkowbacteria bacterium RIFOXYC2_FULL_47_12]